MSSKPTSWIHLVIIDTRTPVGVAQLVHSAWLSKDKATEQVKEINTGPDSYPNMVAWRESMRVIGGRLINAGRMHVGSMNGRSVLNDELVREARDRHRQGAPTKILAADYGVTPSVMSRALIGKTWRHVA